MNKPKLELCPFCGAELNPGRNVHHKPVMRHPYNTACPLSEAQWLDTPGFWERWNRRAPLPDNNALTADCIHDIWSGIRAPTCAAGYMHCDPMTCIAYRHQTEAEDKAQSAQLTAKDAEIERLNERLEVDSQLKSCLSNANALCGVYKADLARVTAERDTANSELNSICGQIDEDEYLRKAFCVHGNSDSEVCPSVGENGYVDVDDCVGCELFCNSWRTPEKQDEEAGG